MKRPHFLVISHASDRTGAPLILLRFLRWVKTNTDLSFEVLLRKSGDIAREFADLCPTAVLDTTPGGPVRRRLRRLKNGIRPPKGLPLVHLDSVASYYRMRGIDLIYSNTITNGSVLEALSVLGKPVITHVHELDSWMRRIGPQELGRSLDRSNRFIAVCKAVKDALVLRQGVSDHLVDVIYGFTELTDSDCVRITSHAAAARHSLGISPGARVVGMCGTMEWRKGSDLLVPLARRVSELMGDRTVIFLWIGGSKSGNEFEQITHDASRAGVIDLLRFSGTISDPMPLFATMDVFTLLSREDPFPLVNLEAAALAKPIVCFDGAGGSPEFVENDAGFVIPYLDMETMAKQLSTLLMSDALADKLGKRAREKVHELHNIDRISTQLVAVIEREFALSQSR